MKRTLVAGVATAALGLAGCGVGDNAPPRPELGQVAPAYAAPTLAGDTVTLASLRGEVVLLNLWATWCAPCRHETPFLQAIHEELAPRGLRIVGVSMDNGSQVELIREFVEEYGVDYTILHDPRMRGLDVYQVLGLPATFLLDRDGVLRWMRYGPVGETDRDFREALEAALG